MIPHPTILLLAWIAFAVAIPWFSVHAMFGASLLLALGVGMGDVSACWRLVRRTRMLFLALLVLYAFATPGTPVMAAWAAPTQEGLMSGAQQAWRLLLLITALALLISRLSREQLLAGLYGLLAPAKPLGLPLESIAVRLWLTLHYAEAGLQGVSLSERWEAALTVPNVHASSFSLEIPAYSKRDLILLVGFCSLLLGALLW